MELEINAPVVGAEKLPDYSEGIILGAFNDAYDYETCISSPDGFKEALESIVVHELVECQTPEEYEEFDSQLKAEIIKFIDLYTNEPWEASAVEPGIAEYIKPAVALVTGKEEFVASEAFTDAVVECAFKTAPFSMQKVTDMVALTDIDLTEKIHNQISETLDDSDKGLPGFVWRYEDGIEKSSMIIAFHNLIKLYPTEELDGKCIEYAKKHINDLFYDSIEENDLLKLPDWDEIDEKKLLGFDPDEIRKIVESKMSDLHWENQAKGIQWSIETDKVIRKKIQEISGELIGVELGLESEIDDFLNEQIKQYIANIPKSTYEEFASSESKLVVFAKAMGIEQELIQMYNEKIIDYDIENFTWEYRNEIASLRWRLCDITGSEDDLTQEYIDYHDSQDEDDAAIEQIRSDIHALHIPPTEQQTEEWE